MPSYDWRGYVYAYKESAKRSILIITGNEEVETVVRALNKIFWREEYLVRIIIVLKKQALN